MRTIALVVVVGCAGIFAPRVGSTAPALAQEQVYEAGSGVTLPRVVKEVKPEYPRSAMDEGVTGTVWLGCVVDREGQPTQIEVKKALHPDLDQAARDALRQYMFAPGTREGRPVAVRITVEFAFTLK
jgi:protein TonB